MIVMFQQKRPFEPINVVQTNIYWQGGLMLTIGRIPQKVKPFFKPIHNTVSAHVYAYYCHLVLAMCISHGSTIDRLIRLLRGRPHRTNHGEFLWRSQFDETAVVQEGGGRFRGGEDRGAACPGRRDRVLGISGRRNGQPRNRLRAQKEIAERAKPATRARSVTFF